MMHNVLFGKRSKKCHKRSFGPSLENGVPFFANSKTELAMRVSSDCASVFGSPAGRNVLSGFFEERPKRRPWCAKLSGGQPQRVFLRNDKLLCGWEQMVFYARRSRLKVVECNIEFVVCRRNRLAVGYCRKESFVV